MKNVLIGCVILTLLLSGYQIPAQDHLNRKERKEQRKLEEKQRLAENLETFKSWIDSGNFVILANTISGRGGITYNLHPSVNFIQVQEDNIVIQTSHPYLTGRNGLGGLTTEGNITDVDVYQNEAGKPISTVINFSTPALGPTRISIQVNGNGNATANLRSNWGQIATFRGGISHPDSAFTFKGMPVF